MPCIRACSRKPIPCPRRISKCSRRKAWCWCSTRSQIRTMSARSCARPPPLRSRPSSPPRATAASGALELVPLVTVQNLARALGGLNERGFMTVGLDSAGSEDFGAVALREPLALVLGAEGKGLRQLTRETCSVVARLDMPGEIKSLNVSNAAVLALYIGASRLGLMG